jgi:hypothetical protein
VNSVKEQLIAHNLEQLRNLSISPSTAAKFVHQPEPMSPNTPMTIKDYNEVANRPLLKKRRKVNDVKHISPPPTLDAQVFP